MGCAYAHGASVVSKSTRATGDAGAVDLGIAYVVNSEALKGPPEAVAATWLSTAVASTALISTPRRRFSEHVSDCRNCDGRRLRLEPSGVKVVSKAPGSFAGGFSLLATFLFRYQYRRSGSNRHAPFGVPDFESRPAGPLRPNVSGNLAYLCGFCRFARLCCPASTDLYWPGCSTVAVRMQPSRRDSRWLGGPGGRVLLSHAPRVLRLLVG